MDKRLLGLLLLPVAVFVLFIGWSVVSSKKAIEEIQSQTSHAPAGLIISGLRSKTKKDGLLISEIEADSLTVLPRKFFVFQIKSINEAIITNARVKLFFYKLNQPTSRESPQEFDSDPVGALFREFAPSGRQSGFISNAKVLEIHVYIFHSGVLVQHVSASSAEWGGDSNPRFYNGAIEDPSTKGIIRSDMIMWDTQRRKFKAVASKSGAREGI